MPARELIEKAKDRLPRPYRCTINTIRAPNRVRRPIFYSPMIREMFFPEIGSPAIPFSETARKWKTQRLQCSGHDVVRYKAIGPSRVARTSGSPKAERGHVGAASSRESGG